LFARLRGRAKSKVLDGTLRSSTTCFPLQDDDDGKNAAVALAIDIFPSWPPPAIDIHCQNKGEWIYLSLALLSRRVHDDTTGDGSSGELDQPPKIPLWCSIEMADNDVADKEESSRALRPMKCCLVVVPLIM
jgi:hypothetical protein